MPLVTQSRINFFGSWWFDRSKLFISLKGFISVINSSSVRDERWCWFTKFILPISNTAPERETSLISNVLIISEIVKISLSPFDHPNLVKVFFTASGRYPKFLYAIRSVAACLFDSLFLSSPRTRGKCAYWNSL